MTEQPAQDLRVDSDPPAFLLDLVPHPTPCTISLAIRPQHLSGTVDHVSNVEYVRWVDRAAELHGDAVGLSRAALLKRGVMWFVARHEIDYRAEAYGGEDLHIATWVERVARVKAWRATVIARASDEIVVCTATTLWVLVDLARRRPIRIPRGMLTALDPRTTPAPPGTCEVPA